MAYTDEEKLRISKQALKTKIMQIDTWDGFKDLVQNVTSLKLKKLVKNSLAVKDQGLDSVEVLTSVERINLVSLVVEVDAL